MLDKIRVFKYDNLALPKQELSETSVKEAVIVKNSLQEFKFSKNGDQNGGSPLRHSDQTKSSNEGSNGKC
ncbi:hypothetical protein LOK49_LG01G00155 [Camellia lanceoleosa]|uniref:Uncharacterized protein n=1 Tax=Camellia lanceoleosa TaxID=1840588 RepID=A0ACC0J0H8_9ERIC|nr:hypothetical protein LOK49_LG01G00155 [Camellia lanceoleosa]